MRDYYYAYFTISNLPSDEQSIIVYILLFERLNVDDYELFVRQFAQFT